jgi:hypothetical protein
MLMLGNKVQKNYNINTDKVSAWNFIIVVLNFGKRLFTDQDPHKDHGLLLNSLWKLLTCGVYKK